MQGRETQSGRIGWSQDCVGQFGYEWQLQMIVPKPAVEKIMQLDMQEMYQ